MLTPWKESYDQLDSIFKSRDIALPTNVRLVKAMVFPVVMYGCESWTINKAKYQRTLLGIAYHYLKRCIVSPGFRKKEGKAPSALFLTCSQNNNVFK